MFGKSTNFIGIWERREATAALNWFRMSILWSFSLSREVNQHILNKFIQMKWWVKWFHTLCTLLITRVCALERGEKALLDDDENRKIIFCCLIELSSLPILRKSFEIWNFLSISPFQYLPSRRIWFCPVDVEVVVMSTEICVLIRKYIWRSKIVSKQSSPLRGWKWKILRVKRLQFWRDGSSCSRSLDRNV